MGTLIYDNALRTTFDDNLLAHLQEVIGQKLRRGESFYLTWRRPPLEGGGRSAIWVDAHIPLAYEYTASDEPQLSPDRLLLLAAAADSDRGLQIDLGEPLLTALAG
jgi:hypothetical protein